MSRLPLVYRASLGVTLALRAWRTPVCVGTNAIVEQDNGKVVLVRHRYMPGLCFPGGGIGSGEAPAYAVQRELKEELGMRRGGPPELFGLYTRKLGWTTNLIVLYRIRDCELDFRPGLEISEMVCVDPREPPPDISAAARRRLAELLGAAPVSPYW